MGRGKRATLSLLVLAATAHAQTTVDICAGANNGQSFTISSTTTWTFKTNTASYYALNANCRVTLSPPPGSYALAFYFNKFDTETNYDFFEITGVVQPSSGHVFPPESTLYAPTEEEVSLIFTSDSSASLTGVSVTVTAVFSSTAGVPACSVGRYTCGLCRGPGSGCQWCPARDACEFTGAASSSESANSFPPANACSGASSGVCPTPRPSPAAIALSCSLYASGSGITCTPGDLGALGVGSTAGGFIGAILAAALLIACLLIYVYAASMKPSAKLPAEVWAAVQAPTKLAPSSRGAGPLAHSASKLLIASAALGAFSCLLLICAVTMPWVVVSFNDEDDSLLTAWYALFLFRLGICEGGSCVILTITDAAFLSDFVAAGAFIVSIVGGVFILIAAAFGIATVATTAVAARTARAFAMSGEMPAGACCLNVQAAVACAWTGFSVSLLATAVSAISIPTTRGLSVVNNLNPGYAAAGLANLLLLTVGILTTLAANRLRGFGPFRATTCGGCCGGAPQAYDGGAPVSVVSIAASMQPNYNPLRVQEEHAPQLYAGVVPQGLTTVPAEWDAARVPTIAAGGAQGVGARASGVGARA